MSVITLEIPDEIVAQVGKTPENLTVLLKETLAAKFKKLSRPTNSIVPETSVYQELVDLLSSSPTTETLAEFKISDAAQERLEDLLYRHREEDLTQAELTELETYIQLSHVVTRLKARARNGQPFLN
jgi:hypothetical protein